MVDVLLKPEWKRVQSILTAYVATFPSQLTCRLFYFFNEIVHLLDRVSFSNARLRRIYVRAADWVYFAPSSLSLISLSPCLYCMGQRPSYRKSLLLQNSIFLELNLAPSLEPVKQNWFSHRFLYSYVEFFMSIALLVWENRLYFIRAALYRGIIQWGYFALCFHDRIFPSEHLSLIIKTHF